MDVDGECVDGHEGRVYQVLEPACHPEANSFVVRRIISSPLISSAFFPPHSRSLSDRLFLYFNTTVMLSVSTPDNELLCSVMVD